MKKQYFAVIFLSSLFFSSCDILFSNYSAKGIDKNKGESSLSKEEEIIVIDGKKKEQNSIETEQDNSSGETWSILVYMPADNNLEPEAINDLCEIEMSKLDTDKVTILALVDRNPGYDASNGNWYNTRLYKMKTGKDSVSKTLISEEIDCEPLGLVKGGNVELDMSSTYVLSDSLKFMRKEFPADRYGLIVWGHGTGWRGESEMTSDSFRAVAFDATTGSYMNLKDFSKALKDGIEENPLDLIGFDTCFGMEFEVLYEIQDYARYCVGSEGLVLSGGWNYEKLFTYFSISQEKSTEALCSSIVKQFSELYKDNSGSSISVFNLQETLNVFLCFEGFMKYVSQFIQNAEVRDQVINGIYQDLIMYSSGAAGSDVYYDMLEMSNSIEKALNDFEKSNPELSNKIKTQRDELIESFSKAIPFYWSYDSVYPGVGIFFGVLSESGLFASMHPNGYVKGKNTNQLNFVTNSNWYVPQKKCSESFLDKLFYTGTWD